MNITKLKIRGRIKRLFDSYPRELLDRWGDIIQDEVLKIVEPYNVIMSYVSLPREVATFKILRKVLEDNKILLVPKVSGEDIISVRIKSLDELSPGTFNVLEPASNIPYDTSKIEVIIVPGIAFNTKLYRIGHGKGHFDRFLKSLPDNVLKIGLAYEFQIIEEEFTDEWDEKMDIIVTEKRRLEE
ncbi:MAG TPA: 5-formyltetrahydrofolate cyclo-ligase [bacterium]|nr:5-formyltetrahydrofolate cyclo-ligase [bacterium]